MTTVALFWLLLATAALAAVAARYGADSRDGRDWQRLTGRVWPERLPARRYTPASDLRAALAATRRALRGRSQGDGGPGRPPRHPYADGAYPAAHYLEKPPPDPSWARPNGRAGGPDR